MKKKFLKEIKRLDTYKEFNEEFGKEDKDWWSSVRHTQAGKLAFELDSPENRFRNDHLWYLYRDDEDVVTEEDNLETCLGHLEFDNILSMEVDQLPEIKAIREPDMKMFLMAHDKVHTDYRKKIIKQCYEQGKFETKYWKIEHNSISSRFK